MSWRGVGWWGGEGGREKLTISEECESRVLAPATREESGVKSPASDARNLQMAKEQKQWKRNVDCTIISCLARAALLQDYRSNESFHAL